MTVLCHKRVWWFRLIFSCTSLHNRISASTNSWGNCFYKSVVNPTSSPRLSLETNVVAVLTSLILFAGCFSSYLSGFFSQFFFNASPHLHESIKHFRLLGGQDGGEPSGNRTKTNPVTPTAGGRRRTHQDTVR